jgi:hypothetical protein
MLLLVAIGLWGCGLFEPEDKKGIRNLHWEQTQIKVDNAQTLLRSIWGSSADNIYAVGHAGGSRTTIWRYDGSKWAKARVSKSNGGDIAGHFKLNDITGFGQNDIWAAGYATNVFRDSTYAFICHFDGATWSNVPIPSGDELLYISGASPDDIWAGGRNGTLMHYDGVSWALDTLPNPILYGEGAGGLVSLLTAARHDLVCVVYYEQNTDGYKFIYNGEEWIEHDGYFNGLAYLDGWGSPEGELYTSGSKGVYQITEEAQNKIFEDEVSFHAISGSSNTDILVLGNDLTNINQNSTWWNIDKILYHYNGTDWYKYPQSLFQPMIARDMWSTQNEVFILGNIWGEGEFGTGDYTVIVHGK